tara:strand:+ start:590 stop:1681 length:1092 start_codon:yes stop_codon:yes gene_type:complete
LDNIANIFRDKKVIITGHTGFKGSWLSLWLSLLGSKLYGISKDIPTDPSNYKSSMIEDLVEDIRMDITEFTKLEKCIEEIQPDFIFHLAAQPIVGHSIKHPLETWRTNTIGTINLLEGIRKKLKKCIAVFITSDKVYDNQEWCWGYRENDKLGGSDPYSASKAGAELSISSYYKTFFKENSDIRICSVRAGNVIGGGDWANNRIIPDCIKSWFKNQSVILRNPYSTRPWQHVLEPLSGYLTVASMLKDNINLNGETYNFGPSSEQNKTVKDLVESLSKYFPYGNYSIDKNYIKNDSESKLLKLNCDKSQNDLKWVPTLDLDMTLKYTSDWYKEYQISPKSTRKISKDQIIHFSKINKNYLFNS